MYRFVAVLASILALTLLVCAQDQTAVPNLTGTWRLDRDRTTENLARVKTDTIVIEESVEEIRFEYYDRDHREFGAETFITDGFERPRYVTRIERAYARAEWKGNRLVIRTRSFLDQQGYQSYIVFDSWERSADGETLINNSSDGKAMVYYRVETTN
jgi:hypothetical protein